MDKETLSNYGWIVICVLVLAVMIALATPFGKFISNAVQNTTQGLFGVNQNALGAVNITIADQTFDDTSGDNGKTEETPAPLIGETYEYGDYIYTAISRGSVSGALTMEEGKEISKQKLCGIYDTTWEELLSMFAEEGMTEDMIWAELKLTEDTFIPDVVCGWKVTINTNITDKNKTEYGAILETINGYPVVDMSSTFSGCGSLIVAPTLPCNLIDMSSTFDGCSSLKTYDGSVAPDGDFSGYIIPSSVTDMDYTFAGVWNMRYTPRIPSSCKTVYRLLGATPSDARDNIIRIPCTIENMGFSYYGSIEFYHIDSCTGACGR